jgi:hypothetical protein
MKYQKISPACAVFVIPMLFVMSGMSLAQSSANYSLGKAVTDAGGGSSGSAHYQVNGAAGQAGGIGAAASGHVREGGGFFANAILVTEVEERKPSEKPNRFALSQNYPNPFNPATTIQFEVMDPCEVSLVVYDLLGRQSSLLIDSHYNPGVYKVTFDASTVSSGVYFYKIRMGTFQAVRKMVVLE